MRNRLLVLAAALALAAVACGDTSTTTAAGPTTTDAQVTITTPVVPSLTVAYSFPVGQSLTYDSDVAMDMTMVFQSDGAADELGDQPIRMGMDISAASTYDLTDGPEPGTVRVAVSHEMGELALREFVVGGEDLAAVMQGELERQFATQGATGSLLPEFEVVVDELGHLVEAESGAGGTPLDLISNPLSVGGLGDLANPVRGFLGPELPDGPIEVGTSWTAADAIELPFTGSEITTMAEYEVVAIEGTPEAPILVIEGVVTTSAFEFDLADMLDAFAESPEVLEQAGVGAAELEELEGARELGMEMRFASEEVSGTSLIRFDVQRGLVIENRSDGVVDMTMRFTLPGEGAVEMEMDGAVVTTVVLRG